MVHSFRCVSIAVVGFTACVRREGRSYVAQFLLDISNCSMVQDDGTFTCHVCLIVETNNDEHKADDEEYMVQTRFR